MALLGLNELKTIDPSAHGSRTIHVIYHKLTNVFSDVNYHHIDIESHEPELNLKYCKIIYFDMVFIL
jgi:hypothetical protein